MVAPRLVPLLLSSPSLDSPRLSFPFRLFLFLSFRFDYIVVRSHNRECCCICEHRYFVHYHLYIPYISFLFFLCFTALFFFHFFFQCDRDSKCIIALRMARSVGRWRVVAMVHVAREKRLETRFDYAAIVLSILTLAPPNSIE